MISRLEVEGHVLCRKDVHVASPLSRDYRASRRTLAGLVKMLVRSREEIQEAQLPSLLCTGSGDLWKGGDCGCAERVWKSICCCRDAESAPNLVNPPPLLVVHMSTLGGEYKIGDPPRHRIDFGVSAMGGGG